eukprot:TRINITY_DN1863_c0_g1_i1.p1 TRINITY_DN1863_c0_g1~~TRINITY_DN1863_c0_g1_i1.p1  ORF type:complete len:646 (+),score=117.48 TRINITY_DN1863_c0_g1_i1:2461-4398(+)
MMNETRGTLRDRGLGLSVNVNSPPAALPKRSSPRSPKAPPHLSGPLYLFFEKRSTRIVIAIILIALLYSLLFGSDDSTRDTIESKRDYLESIMRKIGLSRNIRYNFVVVMVDDLAMDDVGSYGDVIDTLYMDKLSKFGMKFTQAYAAAPTCSAARAGFLSGVHPARLKMTDALPAKLQWPWSKLISASSNSQLFKTSSKSTTTFKNGITSIGSALQNVGYKTAFFGKWNVGPDGPDDLRGFDLGMSINPTEQGHLNSHVCPYSTSTTSSINWWTSRRFNSFMKNANPPPELSESCVEGEHIIDRLSTEVERFLEANAQSGLGEPSPYAPMGVDSRSPFFLVVSHYAAHLPITVRKGLPKPLSQTYASVVKAVDETIGSLIRKLDDLELSQRTIIILTSDNGGVVYEQQLKERITSESIFRGGKGHLYEGGIRVPLIVKWPNIVEPGTECPALVNTIDIFPTLLQIAQLGGKLYKVVHDQLERPIADKLKEIGDQWQDKFREDSHIKYKTLAAYSLDGTSFLEQLLNSSQPRPKDYRLYWHYPHYSNQGGTPSSAIREGNMKLIHFYEDNRYELYNLTTDFCESNNLASENPQLTTSLAKSLDSWRRLVNAAEPVQNPSYNPSLADDGLNGANPPASDACNQAVRK